MPETEFQCRVCEETGVHSHDRRDQTTYTYRLERDAVLILETSDRVVFVDKIREIGLELMPFYTLTKIEVSTGNDAWSEAWALVR